MPGALIGLPSKNIAPNATPSWGGGALANYPAANALTLDPGLVTKSNVAGGDTFRLMFGAPATLVIAAYLNTNWGAGTVTAQTDGGMAAVPVAIPDTEHGLIQHGWTDFRGLSGVMGSQLDLVVSGLGSAHPAIGTIVALIEVESPRTRWGYEMSDVFPTIEKRSSIKQRFIYRIPVNPRTMRADGHWAEDRPLYRSLRRETDGSLTPFLLIPDEDDTDAILVQFVNDATKESYEYFSGSFGAETQSGLVITDLEVEEVAAMAP